MATPINPGISRVQESYSSAVKILSTNKTQLNFMRDNLKPDAQRVEAIYKNAEAALLGAKKEAENSINQIKYKEHSSDYNKEVKKINKKLIKQLGETLVEYNKELIYTTLESKSPVYAVSKELKQMIEDLSNNTVKGKFLRLAASLFEKDFIQKYFNSQYTGGLHERSRIGEWLGIRNKAVRIFKEFKKEFIEAGLRNFERDQSNQRNLTTKSRFDKATKFLDNPQDSLTRNSQIIGIGSLYAVGLVLSTDKAVKQIKSYIAQEADLKERDTFSEKMEFTEHAGKEFKSTFVPLNSKLDTYVSNDADSTFGNIFGDAGASSANREVEHVINGYLNQLEIVGESKTGEVAGEARRLHQVLRHGVIAFRYETDPEKRLAAARQMTEELMTAAVLISIAQSGKKLEDIAKSDKPWKQAVISISLITPDMVLGLVEDVKQLGKGKKKHASEEKMWRSQYKTLKEYNGERTITVGGHTLKVDFKTTSFNTGVNLGANRLGLGTLEQWKTVQAEKKQLDSLTNPVINALDKKKRSIQEKQRNHSIGQQEINELDAIRSQLRDLENLQKDIHRLTRTPFSYLGNGNQYELAAKMEILGNRLADIIKAYPDEDLGIDGIMVLVNCMSAKDRTGAEVACAFTFEVMREKIGHYPTTEEMRKSGMQDIFVRTYKEMLEKYGGDKVTEINVGTGGLKVTKDALLYPNSKAWGNKEEALAKIQKLSGTAGA